ncbi:hypothetical protein SAMD00019534_072600 [Acytostelium subglobosum LB1]|uniref:hypothetical protein n=1 Tax=Acytostelium subglobosum LB1 TaxID=1410327 RepID=UPI000644ED21|nr:hypothetical protein SAMD00019534_072600 [Acytostelium subglobosum LB1]GAM24085.1 hypothetical protein SAMD00019534_072600 [Acytostelium subglobosum LB1]|eukprot:XP_012753121.1 hypothetical protein SAMD00019534_072600 [Acytostelium subglobosum LB1]
MFQYNIRNPLARGKEKEGANLLEDFRNSRTNYEVCIKMLKYRHRLIDVCIKDQVAAKEQIKVLWDQLHTIVNILLHHEGDDEDYLEMFQRSLYIYGANYQKLYGCRLSTYQHILIEHVPDFIRTFGNLDKFSNFSIEGNHRLNKLNIHSSTSGYQTTTGPTGLPAPLLKVGLLTNIVTPGYMLGQEPKSRFHHE